MPDTVAEAMARRILNVANMPPHKYRHKQIKVLLNELIIELSKPPESPWVRLRRMFFERKNHGITNPIS